MSHSYFVRITHPYDKIEPLVHNWALVCDKMLVYQHDGSRTGKRHCHILVVGSSLLKRMLRIRAINLGIDLHGNKSCSFKDLDVSAESIRHTMVYCSKGEIQPHYNKEFDYKTEILSAIDAWVDHDDKTQAEQRYDLFVSKFIPPAQRLEFHRDRTAIGLHSDEDDYREFVYGVVKAQAQQFSMARFKVFSQACQAEVKMLLCTMYFYKDWKLPTRLERVAF